MAIKDGWGRRGQTAFGAVGMIGALAFTGLPGGLGVSEGASTPTLPTLASILDQLTSGSATGGSSSKAPSAAEFRKMGGTSSKNGKLRAGCHNHAYKYSFHPPTSRWAVEVFLTDRTGTHVASDTLLSGGDKTSGTSDFKICRDNTVTGTFTIRSRMNYRTTSDQYAGWMKSSTFKMTKP